MNDVAAILSQQVYQNLMANTTFGDDDRFKVLYTSTQGIPSNTSGYYGAVILDTETNVAYLVNRGTGELNDISADISIVYDGTPDDQFSAARSFFQAYKSNLGADPDYVAVSVATGHSLGGYISQLVGITDDLDSIAIGSPGAQAALTSLDEDFHDEVVAYDESRITFIRAANDPVANHGLPIPGSNVIDINLADCVNQTTAGKIASAALVLSNLFELNSGKYLAFFNPYLLISYGVTEYSAGIVYHGIENYADYLTAKALVPGDALDLSQWNVSFTDGENSRTLFFGETDPLESVASIFGQDLGAFLSSTNSTLLATHIFTDVEDNQYLVFEQTDVLNFSDGSIPVQDLYNGTAWNQYLAGGALDNLPSEFQQFIELFERTRTIKDPLVVDLNGDGRATVVNSSVYFDLDSDGAFSEAVHLWAAPQDGMIVVDLNNNDRADSGAELFSDVSAWNALRAYDLNGDHIINASDAVWTQLHVWQDKNADGATQADEWFSMAELGISTITPPSVGETGSITTTTGTSVVTAYNFTTDTRNTIYTGDTPVDFATLFLPALRGYSTLPDLRAAMSLDNTGTDSLLNNVATLAGKSLSDIAENLVAFRADFLEMMYQWAGVDAISPTSRGDYLTDARKLEFLEEYFGVNFLQARFREANPLSVAGTMVENVFDAVADAAMTKFLFQSGALDLFTTSGHYDRATDSIVFDGGATPVLDSDALLALGEAGVSAPDADIYWATIAFFIGKLHGGLDNFTAAELSALNAAVAATDPAMEWDDVDVSLILSAVQNLTGDDGANTLVGASGDDTLTGLAGNDTLTGNDGNDSLNGGEGDDLLQGNSGTDQLRGGSGNDVLRDGIGSDLIEGGSGNDTYIWEGGADDFIYDEAGATDVLRIGFGGTPYLSFERAANGNDLTVHFTVNNVVNSITLQDQLNPAATAHQIERLEKADGTLLYDLTNISAQVLLSGTTGDDTLVGGDTGPIRNDQINGGDGNDILYGLGGTDNLNGQAGNDTLYGGNGNDTLSGSYGADTLYGGAGDDVLGSDESAMGWTLNGFNDYLDGGEGNDRLGGGYGNDHYYYSSGHDVINDNGGEEILELAPGISFSSLTFYREYTGGTNGENSLTIRIDDDNTILLNIYFRDSYVPYEAGVNGTIETLRLNDGTGDVSINSLITTFSIQGSALADTIIGTSYRTEIIHAGDGDDTITPNAYITSPGTTSFRPGDNVVYAEAGNDTIYTALGSDSIYGGSGNDTIIAVYNLEVSGNLYHGGDTLTAFDADGIDTVNYINKTWNSGTYGLKVDLTDPSAGFASKMEIATGTLVGAQDTLVSIENIFGTNYSDTLLGNDSANTFDGRGGNDTLEAGAGNDVYIFSTGQDVITDSAGIDTLRMSATTFSQGITFTQSNDDLLIMSGTNQTTIKDFYAGKEVEILALDDGSQFDLVNWANWAMGTSSSDTMIGTSANDAIFGLDGADIIDGGDGADVIYGGAGNDQITGGSGNDAIYGGNGTNTINAGDGDDHVYLQNGSSGYLNGEAGYDIADFSLLTSAPLTLSGTSYRIGSNSNSSITGFEKVIGSDFNDTITGTNTDDFLIGGMGNDTLSGLMGTDRLEGGSGDDSYVYVPSYNGQLTILDTDGRNDTLTLQGVSFSGATLTNVGNNLEITFAGSSGKVTILNQNASADAKIEKLIFSDRTYELSASPNLAPDAKNDSFAMTEGETASGNLLADNGLGTDIDGNGDALSVVAASFTTSHGGKVSIVADGAFTYEAAYGYSGTDSFSYTLTDSYNTTDTAVATFNISPLTQHNPTASPDVFSGVTGQVVHGNLLADNGAGADYDLDGSALSIAPATISTEQGGIVVIQANGDFAYTPPSNLGVPDSFEYTLIDSLGGSSRSTASISLAAPNAAPVAAQDSFELFEGHTLTGNVLLNNGHGTDSDPDGNVISVLASTITSASGGSVSLLADGSFSFTPVVGFSGTDSFNYVLLDSNDAAAIGTAVISVIANTPPIAADDAFAINEDTVLNDSLFADNGNGPDTDNESDTLNAVPATIETAHGYVVINSDGTFAYTPDDNFYGADSFSYTLQDSKGEEDSGSVSITVNSVNDAPTVTNNGAALDQNTVLTLTTSMLTAIDVDNTDSQLSFRLQALPGHGTLKLCTSSLSVNDAFTKQDIIDGLVTFTPTTAYYGTDTLSFIATDGTASLTSASFNFTIRLTANVVNGTSANETLNGTNNQDIINGYAGNDTLNALQGNDFLTGGTGSDNLNGGGGDDTYLYGRGDGIDTILEDGGTDSISFGAGILANELRFNHSFSGAFNLDITFTGNATDKIIVNSYNWAYYYRTEKFTFADGSEYQLVAPGGTSADTLNGTTDNEYLFGLGGADTINGNGGNDIIDGGTGNDTLSGGAGDDIYYVDSASDTVTESAGNGNDRIYASVSYTLGSNQYVETLSTISDTATTAINLTGNSLDNKLIGNAGTNTLNGNDGNDALYGGAGSDSLNGGTGNDVYYYNRGDGIDTILEDGGTYANDTIAFGSGIVASELGFNHSFTGAFNLEITFTGNATDKIIVNSYNWAYYYRTEKFTFADGSEYELVPPGSSNADTMNGTSANEYLFGLGGNDTINGNNGNDIIYGGTGNDTLSGNAGNDLLFGGTGTDIYKIAEDSYGSIDTVYDFSKTEGDKLDLSSLLEGYDPNQHAISNFVSLTTNAGNTTVQVDRDGTGSGYTMQDVATIKGQTWSSVNDMLSNGHLIVTD